MKKLLTIVTIFVTGLLQGCLEYKKSPSETSEITDVVSKIYYKRNQFANTYEVYLCDGKICNFYRVEEIIFRNYNVGDSLVIVKSNNDVINIHPKF